MAYTHGVIDADGHVLEDVRDFVQFLPAPYNDPKLTATYSPFPTLDGRLRSSNTGPTSAEMWLQFLDTTGIDVGVIYPTVPLSIGLVQDRHREKMAQVLSRSYNNWVAERLAKHSDRLKPVAVIAPQNPEDAALELRRAVKELGFCGAMLPAVMTPMQQFGDDKFEPIWAEAERLNCPLAIHGAPQHGLGLDIFPRHIEAHVLEHPIPLFMHVTGMVFGGVFERHPRLKIAFLEAGVGWIPYLMDRLDYEYETRPGEAPEITKKPSEYLASGQIYASCEAEEVSVADVIKRFPASCVLYASDYPHERQLELYKHDLEEFQEREDIGDEAKRLILFENAKRFYNL